MAEMYSLYLMEVLMQANGILTLESAWQCFLSRFPQTWNNFADFESFVISQSVLFGLQNNYIFLKDMPTPFHTPVIHQDYNPILQYASLAIPPHAPLMQTLDISAETEAVKYFQRQICRRSEKWVPIKSLAGHLSQASVNVRSIVGPQSDFAIFLQRHPRIFEVQGDLVSLRDEIKFSYFIRQTPHRSARQRRPMSMYVSSNPLRSPNISRESDYLCASHQEPVPLPQHGMPVPQAPLTHYQQPSTQNILVSLADYYAVMWLRQTIDRVGGCQEDGIDLHALMSEFVSAPEDVRNTIGWTQIEVKEFLLKFGHIFEIKESVCKNKFLDRSNTTFFIADSSSTHPSSISLVNTKGVAYCVMKSWGIIDLGDHEHVFFDRSLFKHVGDLTKHFNVGETLCFNAVLAPKVSRAKWRATHVWKETDVLAAQLSGLSIVPPPSLQCPQPPQHLSSNSASCSEGNSDSGVQDATMRNNGGNNRSRKIPPNQDLQHLLNHGGFNVVRLDEAATDKLLVLQEPDEVVDSEDEDEGKLIPNDDDPNSSSSSDLNTMSDIPSISSCQPEAHPCDTTNNNTINNSGSTQLKGVVEATLMTSFSSSQVSAGTQTYFTGDILAKKVYHDGISGE